MTRSEENLEKSLQAINEAEAFLYISMPWWWDDEVGRKLFEAVKNTSKRNIDIKVEIRPDKSNEQIEQRLSEIGIHLTQIPKFHGKAICTEKGLMITTANFFKKDMIDNINFSPIVRDREVIEDHKNNFLKRSIEPRIQLDGPEIDTEKEKLIKELDILNLIKWSKLNALQSKVCRHILYGDENLLVIAPTGSGKTLLGQLAIYRSTKIKEKRAVWIVPSRALANEITQAFSEVKDKQIRPCICLGGEEVSNESLKKANLWICTTEKFESLLRKESIRDITYEIETILIDEIHQIGSRGRGQVLESILSRYKDRSNVKRIIGLSATLENAEEFAGWLNARLLKPPENWKPNILIKKVISYKFDNENQPWNKDHEREKIKLLKQLINDIEEDKRKKGPVIIFCQSKKKCINRALTIASWKDSNESESSKVNSDFTDITDQDFEYLINNRVGFHFSNNRFKGKFFNLFKGKKLDYLFATTGLAEGLNLPCRNVIILDTMVGMNELDINKAEQMLGRAGREYQSEGWGYLICPSYELDKWIKQIGIKTSIVKSVLDKHLSDVLLAEFYLRNIKQEQDAFEFYKRSLKAYESGKDDQSIQIEVIKAINTLLENYFLVRNQETNELITTEVGDATIKLMINSDVAISLINGCNKLNIPSSYKEAEIKILKLLSESLPNQNIYQIDNDLQEYISSKLLSIGIVINNHDQAIANIGLLSIYLALNDPEEIKKLKAKNNEIRNYVNELLEDQAPRYFSWLSKVGWYSRSPWVVYCAWDLSKRVKWHMLKPKPTKGSSKLINFMEQLTDPEQASTLIKKAWDQAQFKGFDTPLKIPKTTKELSFCKDSHKIQKRIKSLVNHQDISIEYDDSLQQFRVLNLPSDARILFAEVFRFDEARGTQTYITQGRDHLLSIPFDSKENEKFKIILSVETSFDKDLLAYEKEVTNLNLKSDNERFNSLLKKEIAKLPNTQRISKKDGFLKSLGKRLLGIEIDESDLREWVTAKRQYYRDLAEVITQQNQTIEKQCRDINQIINKIIKLKSSLNSEPYSFRSIPSILKSGIGTKFERELCKLCLASNSGFSFGLVKGIDHTSIYSICKLNDRWFSFENLLHTQLTPIFPSNLACSDIELLKSNSTHKESKPVDIKWINDLH